LPVQKQTGNQLSAQATAELIVLLMMIYVVAGPLSGSVLSTHAFFSSLISKSQTQIESTKNVAQQLLAASDRIKTLEAKLAQNQVELTKYKQQAKDTDNLRALLNLKNHTHRKAIAADVVSRDVDNWYEQATLDKGSLNGVTKGSAVITSNGVVGQVTTVSDNACIVRLLTDPDQKLGVLIPRIGLTGILSGRHQDPAIIDFVPIGTNVDVKDKVVCRGKAGTFPENHPVGTVIGVRRDSNATTAQIQVRLAENCYDLSQVLILPPLED
jgi:rod shape-determining protein MreC